MRVADLRLSLACCDYDRTRPLIDGRVKPAGIKLDMHVMRPRVAFDRMLAGGDFDASEMSFSTYIALKAEGSCPFVAIPVMLSKSFRHDCIYIRADSGIRGPRDLAGRRVGTMRYNSTALVFIRGMLQHDFGVHARAIKWLIGGVNEPVRSKRPDNTPDDIQMTLVPNDQTLDAMLARGEIDALFTQDIPMSFLRQDPHIVRLFQGFKAVEIDYFRRTRIFPVMHTIVIRDALHRMHPWVAHALFDAFAEAKDIALRNLYDTDALHLSLPFLIDHLEEATRVFGKDFFSYGLEPNRETMAALCQYLHEQNISSRLVSPDELFADLPVRATART
jgi:4,5-dihydroxyphthalate decarboxylase